MAAVLTGAAAALTAAATAAVSGVASTAASHSSKRRSSRSRNIRVVDAAHNLRIALNHVQRVFITQNAVCGMFPARNLLSDEAGLTAAPAAVRLILTTLQSCSQLQQLAGSEDGPAPVLLLGDYPEFLQDCGLALWQAHCNLLDLAAAVRHEVDQVFGTHGTWEGALQLLTPRARELLLCPELVPCLAAAVLVAVLGLETGAQGDETRSDVGAGGAAGPANSSSATSSSSSAADVDGTTQASAARISGRLGNGISLDSLTPLSRGAFSLLGVEQVVLVQAVEVFQLFHPHVVWGTGCHPDQLDLLLAAYGVALQCQVSGVSGNR
jgi:hypothetical protein